MQTDNNDSNNGNTIPQNHWQKKIKSVLDLSARDDKYAVGESSLLTHRLAQKEIVSAAQNRNNNIHMDDNLSHGR